MSSPSTTPLKAAGPQFSFNQNTTIQDATSNTNAPAASGMRAALRSEPDRLRRHRADLQHQIQALSLSNFQVHIANFHCEENVRRQLSVAGTELPVLSGVVSSLASDADGLEADLSKLHSEHTRLRRTLTQHNSLLELLEAPSVMEACIRSGMLDEALDVADYATVLFFTHKLWSAALAVNEPTESVKEAASRVSHVRGGSNFSTSSATASIGHANHAITTNTGAAEIIRQVVSEIRTLASELRESILAQLSGGRVTLSMALKLLGHLRRLYTQQALARKRSAAHLSAAAAAATSGAKASSPAAFAGEVSSPSAQSSSATAPVKLDASAFAMTPEEDAAIVQRVRLEFLAARDAWHRGELETIPRHNSHQYVSWIVL